MAAPVPLNTQASVSDRLVLRQNPCLMANSNFTLFPKLPTELRLIVWEMALPEARCLDVFEHVEEPWKPANPSNSTYWVPSHFNDKSPAILFTSREARKVALKYYQAVEAGRPQIYQKTFYMDPCKDILFCRIVSVSPNALKGIARMTPNITKLAMTSLNIRGVCYAVEELKLLGDLKELMALPVSMSTRPYGHSVFKDLDEQAWDSIISHDGHQGDRYYFTIRGWEDFWNEKNETNEGWVAPKLRIGVLVKGD